MYNKEKATENFRKLLQCETVAGNETEFTRFRNALNEMYPNINRICKLETVGEKGMMYHLKGKSENESIILMAHYDVVPADKGQWKYPPFSGAEAEGKIWGRGALDTKCTLCAIMESVEEMLSEGFTPRAGIYLCFGGDEETTGNSAVQIAELLKQRKVKPFLILDEGGAVVDGGLVGINRKCALVGIAEKGYMDVEFIARGAGGHSSLVGAVNPIVSMSEVVRRLNSKIFKPRLCEPLKIMIGSAAKYTDKKHIKLLNRYQFLGKLLRKSIVKKLPEIDALTRTVGAVTQILGGSADNVIPEQVRAVGNFRIINGSSVNETLNIIKKALSGIEVEVNAIIGLEPTAISDTSGPGWKVLSEAISKTWEGSVLIPYLMMARSDSRCYNVISDNVYRFTPVAMTKNERASIHGVNENISNESFYKIIDFYIYLIMNN